jgi:hypothetical protein
MSSASQAEDKTNEASISPRNTTVRYDPITGMYTRNTSRPYPNAPRPLPSGLDYGHPIPRKPFVIDRLNDVDEGELSQQNSGGGEREEGAEDAGVSAHEKTVLVGDKNMNKIWGLISDEGGMGGFGESDGMEEMAARTGHDSAACQNPSIINPGTVEPAYRDILQP